MRRTSKTELLAPIAMSLVGDIPGSDPLAQEMSVDLDGEPDDLFDMSDKFPVSRIPVG